jgi:hypothetical protein
MKSSFHLERYNYRYMLPLSVGFTVTRIRRFAAIRARILAVRTETAFGLPREKNKLDVCMLVYCGNQISVGDLDPNQAGSDPDPCKNYGSLQADFQPRSQIRIAKSALMRQI